MELKEIAKVLKIWGEKKTGPSIYKLYGYLEDLFEEVVALTKDYNSIITKGKNVERSNGILTKKIQKVEKRIEQYKEENERLKHKRYTINEIKTLRIISRQESVRAVDICEDE